MKSRLKGWLLFFILSLVVCFVREARNNDANLCLAIEGSGVTPKIGHVLSTIEV